MGVRYQRYVGNYLRFLRRRRYAELIRRAKGAPPPFDWPFIRQAFLLCWTQPGFHLFWRQWNPGIAYFTYQFYRFFGGDRNRTVATIAAFGLCGICHSLAVWPFYHWSYIWPVAFLSFAILSLISWRLHKVLKQKMWPVILNTAMNICLLIGSIKLGFFVDRWLRQTCV